MLATLMAVCTLGAIAPAAAVADCSDIRWEVRWSPDLSGATGGSLISVPVCYDGRTAAPAPTKRTKRQRREPTRAQYHALWFVPSAEVSRKVQERMIEQQAVGDAAAAVTAFFRSDQAMRQFRAAVRRTGWSTRDLGDMYAYAYTQMWLLVNEQTRISTPVQKAVRADLRRRLALDRRVRRQSDAAQQETAEWLGSWTVVAVGGYNTQREQGGQEAADAWRDHMRERLDSVDIFDQDLTQVRLTRKGVVKR